MLEKMDYYYEKLGFGGGGGGAMMGKLTKYSWSPLFLLITVIALLSFQIATRTVYPIRVMSGWLEDPGISGGGGGVDSCVQRFFGELPKRKVVRSIEEFGGVGDGTTSNTETFRKAIRYMHGFGEKGGSQLNVPKGRWLTGSFNLTSNFTLFLEEGAVILGSQVCYLFLFIYLFIVKEHFVLFL